MKFSRSEPDLTFDVAKFLSETGVWEIGIRKLLYGLEVCGNPVGDDACTFFYPAGNDGVFTLTLLATIINILAKYPENVTYQQIEKDFPKYEIKPINRDPYCWKRLQEMAEGDRSVE